GGPSPTVAPTPLSYPFYVLRRNGQEERHWLRADTNYPIDIAASRLIGQNARARVDQALSGLIWRTESDLCDVTQNRGVCTAATAAIVPPAPAPPPDATTPTPTPTPTPASAAGPSPSPAPTPPPSSPPSDPTASPPVTEGSVTTTELTAT